VRSLLHHTWNKPCPHRQQIMWVAVTGTVNQPLQICNKSIPRGNPVPSHNPDCDKLVNNPSHVCKPVYRCLYQVLWSQSNTVVPRENSRFSKQWSSIVMVLNQTWEPSLKIRSSLVHCNLSKLANKSNWGHRNRLVTSINVLEILTWSARRFVIICQQAMFWTWRIQHIAVEQPT